MKDKFIECGCHCGAIRLSYTRAWGLEMAFLRTDSPRIWSNRLRLAWAALKGTPYNDMVILEAEQVKELEEYLQDIRTTDHAEAEHEEVLSRIDGILCGVHCETAVDGILQWLKTPDCSFRTLQRLYNEIDKNHIKPWKDKEFEKFKEDITQKIEAMSDEEISEYFPECEDNNN